MWLIQNTWWNVSRPPSEDRMQIIWFNMKKAKTWKENMRKILWSFQVFRLTPLGFWCHMFSNGICQIMMVEVLSSWRDCLVFLLTLRWPRPPDTTSRELTSILLERRPLWWWAGSWSKSYNAPSSGPCSREPWEGAKEPQEEEDRESWRAMVVQPASPSHTPLPWGGLEAVSDTGWVLSASTDSICWSEEEGVEDGRLDDQLRTAVAMVRNLTGPLCACNDTIPRPKESKNQLWSINKLCVQVLTYMKNNV